MERPARPHLIGEYIDCTLAQSRSFSEKYDAFVLSSRMTQLKIEQTAVLSAIVEGKIHKPQMISKSSQVVSIEIQPTLSFVLDFYAKFSLKGASTFAGIDNSYESWGITEVELFCRDFSLIPKLISRDEVRRIWHYMSVERKTRGSGSLKHIKEDGLRELLARIAIFVYGKPGIISLLSSVGIDVMDIGNPIFRIKNLIHYLKLADYDSIKSKIRTVGRNTQGKLNMTSQQERRTIYSENKIIDTEFRKTVNSAASPEKGAISPSRSTGALHSLCRTKEGDKDGKKRSQSMNKNLPAEINELFISQSQPQLILNDAIAAPARPSSPVGLVPSEVRPLPTKEDADKARTSLPSTDSKADSSQTGSVDVGMNGGDVGSGIVESYGVVEAGSRIRDREFELQASMELYTPDLANLFMPYCKDLYNDTGENRTQAVVSHGPFLDIGRVPPKATCVINVHVTNTSQDELRFDITARDFDVENTKVRTIPTKLIPGFSRVASVSFQVGDCPRCSIGYVDIKYVSERNALVSDTISIPIYYFIGLAPLDDKDRNHVPLTIATLSSSMRSRLGVQEVRRKFGYRTADLGRKRGSGLSMSELAGNSLSSASFTCNFEGSIAESAVSKFSY